MYGWKRSREQRRRSQKYRRQQIRRNAETQFVCIACGEGSNRELGQVLEPCDCHDSDHRYHYQCLTTYIEATGDKPCERCHKRFRSRGIRRVTDPGPTFGRFIIKQILNVTKVFFQIFSMLIFIVLFVIIPLMRLLSDPEANYLHYAGLICWLIAIFAWYYQEWYKMYERFMATNFRIYDSPASDVALLRQSNRKVRRVNLSKIKRRLDLEEHNQAATEISALLDQDQIDGSQNEQTNRRAQTIPFIYGPLVLTSQQAQYLVTNRIPVTIITPHALHIPMRRQFTGSRVRRRSGSQ